MIGIGIDEHLNSRQTGTNRHGSAVPNFQGVKVLVVDDSADNRDLVSAILRPTGADVSLAENGKLAVDLALSHEFDILMDVQMPELDGHAATKLLRTKGYKNPIVALTANAFREDRALAFAAGFDDHLTKPIQKSALFQVIEHYVRKNSAI